MPFQEFDRSRLLVLPLGQRVHDVDRSVHLQLTDEIAPMDDPRLDTLAKAVVDARTQHQATVLLMYGAHVIRTGCALHMIELMKQGLVTHFATNGAGSIHDFELALLGKTCESVARYISEGQFGLWQETGLLNDIVKQGLADGLGYGEAVGRYIWENKLPYREQSVLAMGYHLQVPCTVHVNIGSDIIHQHPNCDGAALGAATYKDFLIYCNSIENLENGVFFNFGSAVTGPEVYLKALAMARNVAHQQQRKICHFTTAVFDLLAIQQDDSVSQTPPKSDPRYYFRPWKTILARTVADGGQSHYIQGEHHRTLPNLTRKILAKYATR